MNNSLCLAIVLFLMQGAACSLEMCARLEFVNLTGNSLRAAENELINITFFVSWENCSHNHVYLVKVSRLGEINEIMDLCKIIRKNNIYSVSQPTNSCRIASSSNNIEFSEQVKSSDTAFIFSVSVDDLSERIEMNISIWQQSSNFSADTTATLTITSTEQQTSTTIDKHDEDTTATMTTMTTTEQQTSTTIDKHDEGSSHTKKFWISLVVSVVILVTGIIIFFSVYWLTSRTQKREVDPSRTKTHE